MKDLSKKNEKFKKINDISKKIIKNYDESNKRKKKSKKIGK